MLIDKQKAMADLGIPEEMYNELVQLFISQTGPALEKLAEALTSQNLSEIAGQAHFIKGSAANLRLEELHLQAKEIEFGAKENKDLTVLQEATERLKVSFMELKNAVSSQQ